MMMFFLIDEDLEGKFLPSFFLGKIGALNKILTKMFGKIIWGAIIYFYYSFYGKNSC